MTVLQVAPDAPAWAHIGADALLVLHIGGGAIGILSGTTALLARKGETVHRAAGKVFFVSMLVCYSVATVVSPFLTDGQRTNTVAGILALYLLITGWRTARRTEATPARIEIAGFFIALAIIAAGLFFIQLAAGDPTGTIDGSPPEAFYIFAAAGSFGAAGDLHLILRRRLGGVTRIARHLWRMCFSLFIASGSFFLGQQQVMPEWMRGSPALIVAALAPFAFMAFYLVRVHIGRRFKDEARA